ncbi:MAG TPA: CAP domain-containing protein [Anaerolineales bacterium]
MDPYSLISEVNALRAANGLPGYSINPVLMAVAQQHAQYMSVAGVTHFGADGSTPWQRGLAAGYPLAGDLSLGGFYSENITAGRNKSVQQAVSEWQGDALHLNTMLSPNLTEIGVGVALVGDYVYYVIDCARPTASGQPQVYTPIPGQLPATGSTAVIVPRVVNTLVPSTPLADGKLYHVVKPGETLWLIAVSYGVKVADLRRLNNLTDTQDIFPGNKLYIQILNSATPAAPSPTATFPPTNTQLPTVTLYPTATLTLTPLPISSIPVESSTLVVAVIVIVALVLSAVIVRSGRRN